MLGIRLGGARPRVALAVMVSGALAALAGTAAADTTAFHATAKGPSTKPAGCPEGAFICGHAQLAGYGTAEYRFFLDTFQPVSDSCGDYTATVVFIVDAASTLTLNDVGRVCGPGGSFFPQPAPGGSYGNPVDGSGSWTVRDGTGVFAGLTGSGTDEFHNAGAHFRATYRGTVDD